MKHPWESVPLSDYEAHMRRDEIRQLQTLNEIMKKQMAAYTVKTLAVLGVAGGNGLAHIKELVGLKRVYGIDINADYLAACKERYGELSDRLILIKSDLSDLNQSLPEAELIIANLFIEYIGVETFAIQIKKARPAYVSCVIQKNTGEEFVSNSPYAQCFMDISLLHRDVEEEELTAKMEGRGLRLILKEKYGLPNGKQFIRLDYAG